MASYSVRLKASAKKELDDLAPDNRQRILAPIAALADDPRPYGYEQLSGEKKYRLRQGDYRIVYGIDDKEALVTVVKIGHRRDVCVRR